MIIELVGLPASGKTTLAQELTKKGAVIISASQGIALALLAFRFYVRHPILFFKLTVLTLRFAPPKLRYSLFVNLVLVHGAKYYRAHKISAKGLCAVLDQGFFQNTISMFNKIPSLALFQSYCALLPMPDVLMVVTQSEERRNKRLQQRGRLPRAYAGEEESLRFLKLSVELEKMLITTLPTLPIFYYMGDALDVSNYLERFSYTSGVYMPHMIKQSCKKIFYGFLYFIYKLFSQRKDTVVLMYHSIEYSKWKLAVPPHVFDRQMRYVAKHYVPVPLTEAIHARNDLRKSRVAITFDDGYKDLITTVLPIIEKYSIPITVFVPSDLHAQTGSDEGRKRLTCDELTALAQSSLVKIESHAKTHIKLPSLSESDVRLELRDSKEELAQITAKEIHYFAYPFGARSQSVEALVQEAGYHAAFGISDGVINRRSPLFALPRVQIDATTSFFLFRVRLTRVVAWGFAIRRFFKST